MNALGCVKYMPYNIESPKTFGSYKGQGPMSNWKTSCIGSCFKEQPEIQLSEIQLGDVSESLHWSSIHNIIPVTINIVVNILLRKICNIPV